MSKKKNRRADGTRTDNSHSRQSRSASPAEWEENPDAHVKFVREPSLPIVVDDYTGYAPPDVTAAMLAAHARSDAPATQQAVDWRSGTSFGMPLIGQVVRRETAGVSWLPTNPVVTGTRMPMARQMVDDSALPDDCVLVDVQVAADVCGDQVCYPPENLGPVRPGFEHMFLEWATTLPDGEMRMAAYIQPATAEDTAGGDGFRMIIFRLHETTGRIECYGVAHAVILEDDGTIFSIKQGLEASMADAAGFDRSSPEFLQAQENSRAATTIALTALSLMNCRNVKTEELGEIKRRRSGSEKRRRVPPKGVRYRTIILPGGGSQRSGTGSGTHHRASALHRVRGHFKTYTAEAPLMGRAVGTFWWSWNVRGHQEHGEVIADYKLG
jgi:hypothetical protein